MPTTPTRLRNWAGFVRAGTADLARVADMLEHCATRFESYEARVKELENEVAKPLHQTSDEEKKWLMTCSNCGETYDKSDDARHDCL